MVLRGSLQAHFVAGAALRPLHQAINVGVLAGVGVGVGRVFGIPLQAQAGGSRGDAAAIQGSQRVVHGQRTRLTGLVFY